VQVTYSPDLGDVQEYFLGSGGLINLYGSLTGESMPGLTEAVAQVIVETREGCHSQLVLAPLLLMVTRSVGVSQFVMWHVTYLQGMELGKSHVLFCQGANGINMMTCVIVLYPLIGHDRQQHKYY
jgi:hypothetical protein